MVLAHAFRLLFLMSLCTSGFRVCATDQAHLFGFSSQLVIPEVPQAASHVGFSERSAEWLSLLLLVLQAASNLPRVHSYAGAYSGASCWAQDRLRDSRVGCELVCLRAWLPRILFGLGHGPRTPEGVFAGTCFVEVVT